MEPKQRPSFISRFFEPQRSAFFKSEAIKTFLFNKMHFFIDADLLPNNKFENHTCELFYDIISHVSDYTMIGIGSTDLFL